MLAHLKTRARKEVVFATRKDVDQNSLKQHHEDPRERLTREANRINEISTALKIPAFCHQLVWKIYTRAARVRAFKDRLEEREKEGEDEGIANLRSILIATSFYTAYKLSRLSVDVDLICTRCGISFDELKKGYSLFMDYWAEIHVTTEAISACRSSASSSPSEVPVSPSSLTTTTPFSTNGHSVLPPSGPKFCPSPSTPPSETRIRTTDQNSIAGERKQEFKPHTVIHEVMNKNCEEIRKEHETSKPAVVSNSIISHTNNNNNYYKVGNKVFDSQFNGMVISEDKMDNEFCRTTVAEAMVCIERQRRAGRVAVTPEIVRPPEPASIMYPVRVEDLAVTINYEQQNTMANGNNATPNTSSMNTTQRCTARMTSSSTGSSQSCSQILTMNNRVQNFQAYRSQQQQSYSSPSSSYSSSSPSSSYSSSSSSTNSSPPTPNAPKFAPDVVYHQQNPHHQQHLLVQQQQPHQQRVKALAQQQQQQHHQPSQQQQHNAPRKILSSKMMTEMQPRVTPYYCHPSPSTTRFPVQPTHHNRQQQQQPHQQVYHVNPYPVYPPHVVASPHSSCAQCLACAQRPPPTSPLTHQLISAQQQLSLSQSKSSST